jgi:hypothetical protein
MAAEGFLAALEAHVEETNSRGYAARHKKGKPLPKKALMRAMVAQSQHKIGVVGPDFVGVTTVLQKLQQGGYKTVQLVPKPPAELRTTFQWGYFERLVHAWGQLPDEGPACLIEDTPWAYLARHSVHVDVHTRQAAHKLLTSLALPTFHVVLHTTGVTVGRRHPSLHATPEQFSVHALRQMGLLAHLPAPCFNVDATMSADIVAARVQNILEKKVFRVQTVAAEKAEV